MYSYDVASPSRPSAAGRSIPSMRPSYDAEHPSSATPIYDTLYSEYRRLFRALPGDRSGEENMRFTGFAVREPVRHELMPYQQHQSFQTFAGQTHGAPQFMPAQQSAPGQFGGGAFGGGAFAGGGAFGSGGSGGGAAGNAGPGQYGGAPGPANGQGWVAAGYLAPAQSAAAPGAPAGTVASAPPDSANGNGTGPGGRHRSMLSLPPGRATGPS